MPSPFALTSLYS
jgi:NADH:ubiquinone oxidoreductase subunit 6 (subunit J)